MIPSLSVVQDGAVATQEGCAGSGWFAARPSGAEDVYKIYAGSLLGAEHLELILAEARELVRAALEAAAKPA